MKQKLILPDTVDKSKVFYISASTTKGIDALKEAIYEIVIDEKILESKVLITNERHLEVLRQALKFCEDTLNGIKQNNTLDLISIDLNNVWLKLGEITGNTNNEMIIDNIFKNFCVGK